MAPRVPCSSLLALFAASAILLTGCSGDAAGGSDARPGAKAARPVPLVSVVRSHARDIAVEVQSQGHLVPLNQVLVRSQVTARISKVHFREGERVAAGQLLFTLESADAVAQLERVRAQAAQVRSQLDAAQRDYERAGAMVKANFMSPSTLDSARSKVDGLAAQRRGAQAEIAAARVSLALLRIVAPIAARTGAIGLHPGGLAQPGSPEPLVTLVQLDPIGVEFSVPEQLLPAILAAQAGQPLAVMLEAQDGRSYQGRLAFIDSTVNRDSGTIALKALFANPEERLWPGTFARITLRAGASHQAFPLAAQALQEGPGGRFVFVLDRAGRVKLNPVTLLRMQDSQAIVTGIEDGQQVITEGPADQLHEGAAVRIAAAAGGRP